MKKCWQMNKLKGKTNQIRKFKNTFCSFEYDVIYKFPDLVEYLGL